MYKTYIIIRLHECSHFYEDMMNNPKHYFQNFVENCFIKKLLTGYELIIKVEQNNQRNWKWGFILQANCYGVVNGNLMKDKNL